MEWVSPRAIAMVLDCQGAHNDSHSVPYRRSTERVSSSLGDRGSRGREASNRGRDSLRRRHAVDKSLLEFIRPRNKKIQR
jgi:hypothetical protein